jgi:hypothetical protein
MPSVKSARKGFLHSHQTGRKPFFGSLRRIRKESLFVNSGENAMNTTGALAIALMITGVLVVVGSRSHPDALQGDKPAAVILMKDKVLLGLGAITITLGGTLMLLVGLSHMRRESRLRYY